MHAERGPRFVFPRPRADRERWRCRARPSEALSLHYLSAIKGETEGATVHVTIAAPSGSRRHAPLATSLAPLLLRGRGTPGCIAWRKIESRRAPHPFAGHPANR